METRICRVCGKEKLLKGYPDKWSKRKSGWTKIGKRNECMQCTHLRRKKLYDKDPRIGILANIKQRVRVEKLDFDLVLEDIVIPELCPILEIPLKRGTTGDYKYSPTADRIDNSKGYTKDNIRIISMMANKMKNNANKEELYLFSKNIMNYLNDDIV